MSAATDPGAAAVPIVRVVREAAVEELATWDERTVDPPGGDVQQSRAWAAHRARTGWHPHQLVLDDDAAVLALGRRTPALGGGRLYVPKGPVAAGSDAAQVAGRLAAVAGWARDAGYDTIVATRRCRRPAASRRSSPRSGSARVEEIGPSRHRMTAPIVPGADDDALLAPIAKKTRQRFLAAERRGMRVVRYDATGGPELPGVETPPPPRLLESAGESFAGSTRSSPRPGTRRGFAHRDAGPRALAWWRAALEAGHLVLLEVRSARRRAARRRASSSATASD